MNFLKHILKKELRNFLDRILPAISESRLCEKYSCKWQKCYLLTCSQCRDIQCSSRVMFNSAIEILMKSLDNDGKNYFKNFVTDFLGISDVSLNDFFDVEKNSYESKERKKTFDVKVYHKS